MDRCWDRLPRTFLYDCGPVLVRSGTEERAATMTTHCVGLRAFNRLRLIRIGWICTSFAMAFGVAAPVRAQNKFWITSVGGSFATNANWATSAPPGGVGPAPPPGAAEIANFT